MIRMVIFKERNYMLHSQMLCLIIGELLLNILQDEVSKDYRSSLFLFKKIKFAKGFYF